MLRVPFPLIAYCCLASSVTAEPVISEFMASNQNGIADENGDKSDWIEIRNPDATAISLSGWALTDSTASPQKWLFPAVTLPATSHLLVFASGKDKRVVGQPLHTNFSLSAGGEYLALVRPDGTRSTEWAPTYPLQYPDISYGTSIPSSDVTYVQQTTPVKAMAATTSPPLATDWRTTVYDDTGWRSGTFAVGYMNANASPNLGADLGVNLGTGAAPLMNDMTARHSYTRAAFSVPDKNAVQALTLKMNFDDGFVAWINGTFAASFGPAATTFPLPPTSTVGIHGPGAYEDFPLPAAARNALVNGTNILAIEGLNTSTSSSDCFILPQLIGTLSASGPGVTGYFTAATPGIINGGVNTVQIPIQATFSRPSGTFSDPFQLSLGGTTAGQEIHYVVADPSSTVGADVPEPTLGSTLYTGPIAISSSKLVRAAIFQGTQKSRAVTAQYLQLETGLTNNTSNFTSILPILVLDDHQKGEPITSESTYTTTLLHLFEPVGGITRLADAVTHDANATVFSRAGTHIRGSSSGSFPKKSYGMETWDEFNVDRDQSMLGLASDSDWVLNGPWLYDDTFIHNAFIDEISRRIGRWAPRTRFCEVFFNQNGGKLDYTDYVGVYVLTEKIKSGHDRLDIAGIEPENISGTALTGGYIFKIDRADSGEVSWNISNSSFGLGNLPNAESGQALVLVEPDPQADTPEQIAYIQNTAILPFNNTLFAERATGFATRNYRNHIDVSSFIDHSVLNSLAYNVDALRLSAFFFKDRNKKISAGPLWDADRALGSDDGRDSNPASWGAIQYFFDRDWWGGLFKDPQFVQEWVDRWWELRQPGRPFANTALTTLADEMGAQIGNTAGKRDADKWPDNAASGSTYLNEIAAMKSWLVTRSSPTISRVNFIDSQTPGPPTASAASGPAPASVTLSGAGTIRYTLNGTDPRPFGGATPGTGLTYSGALPITATTVLTARRQITPAAPFAPDISAGVVAPIAWSAPLTRVYLVSEAFAIAGDLAISEINYHPTSPTPGEAVNAPGTDSDDYEWIELKNVGARVVNTFEMTFPPGFPFEQELRLLPKTLSPGQSALVVKNRTAFQARYGAALNASIVGEWRDGNLSDGGEEIRLLARDGSSIHAFAYGDGNGWPDRADGAGATLEYTGALLTNAEYANAANWRSSSEVSGSPGTSGTGPDVRIVINEILSHSNLPRVDAIELRNNSAIAVNVGGWFISDVGSAETVLDYKKFRIPDPTFIPVGGYAVFTETQFNPNGLWNPNAGIPGPEEFAFDAQHGEDAWLVSAEPGGTLLKFIDHVDFGAARPDETWGRYPNGTGSFWPLLSRTLLDEASATVPRPGLGATNGAVRVGPVIIQEIHHTPPGGNTDLEFVELFNPTNASIPLAHWRLRGEVDYNFLPSEAIPAGGVLVVVPFAPNDTAKANAFRTAHGTSSSIVFAGPWDTGDHLGTTGKVTLYRAELPPPAEPSFYPQTVEDECNYAGNGGGWPNTTGGLSLNRAFRSFADAPPSWFADAPSPGGAHLRFGYWKSIWFPSGGTGSGDHEDFDHDGLDTSLEFSLQTNPLISDPLGPVLPTVASQPGSGGTTDYLFTYVRPLDHVGVTYTVEQSTSLAGWAPVEDVQISTTATSETRRATVNPSGGSRLFLRLTVTITP